MYQKFTSIGIIRISFLLVLLLTTQSAFTQQPTILSFFPASATVGTTVRIQGFNFSGVSSVMFGGVSAASFSYGVDSIEYINAVVGPGSSGSVSVTNDVGTASKTGFTFTAPAGSPTVSSFFPTSATTGNTVVIQGANLSGVTAVNFGGTAATSFTIVSDTSVRINAVVGPGSSGGVSVTNSVGTSVKIGFIYFSNAPIITSFTPSTGPSGTGVIIRGTNFNGTTSVKFNNVATTFTVDSASKITTTVPGGATSGIILVTSPNGTGSSSTNFTVNTSASGTINICPGGNGVASSNISGSSYQWQVQTDSGFINLSNSTNYAGVNTIDLQLNTVPTSWYGKKYRCMVNGTNVSNTYTIVISNNWSG